MNLHRFLAVAVIVVFASGSRLGAQPPGGPVGPRQPAPFSPYLNLTRQGATPAVNYYGIVRPQLQFANSIQNLQRQVDVGPFSGPSAGPEQPLLTGHTFGFQNHYAYFQNQYSGVAFGTGLGGTGRGAGGFGSTSGRPLTGAGSTPSGSMPLGPTPSKRR